VESDDDDNDDDFEEEEDQVEVLRGSLHPKVTKSVKKEPTPPPTVVTRRRSGKTMEVSLPRTMPHIRVEGPIPSTPVLSLSKGSRSSNKKGKTPASGSKTKAKTSHTPKLVLSRTSLEAEIPNISARELEEVSASAETPLVSPFDFFSYLFPFTEIFCCSLSLCAPIALHTTITTANSVAGTSNVTVATPRAALAALSLCPLRIGLTQTPSWLLSVRMRLLASFLEFFSIISLSDPFLLSDLPLALSQYHQTVANYAGLSALALNARQQMHQAIQRIGDILFSVSDDGNRVFPDYLSNDAVEAALQVLDVVEGPEFNQADDQLAFLTGALGTKVFQDLFSRFPGGQVHPQAGSSSAMILSTPPNITAPLDPQSTDNSPPHKRARATKKADPLPFAPSIAASRNVSQGEGSSSTLPVTRSRGGSKSGTGKRKRAPRT
jgi:hypothetical protein